ncbi:MAG: DUF1592 domain-containing protein, partial [Myxococcales bacterium]|nr:DUF1592 domain-containing protein [Myxococcales bacterium]
MLAGLLLTGCVGGIDGAEGPARNPEEAGYDDDTIDGASDVPAPATRVPRITHEQWENTVQDLLGLDEPTGLSAGLRADAKGGSIFGNEGGQLVVDDSLWGGYQRAAADVAELVMNDATIVDRILPAGADLDARAQAFVTTFGLRAYRRPLTADEVSAHVALFKSAATLIPDRDAETAGVGLLIELFLQSPHFLYRFEPSSEASGEKIPLGPYEVASRLSYMLWNTMPDDELFAAAAKGDLNRADVAGEQARRMLADPRAEETVTRFHRMLYQVNTYDAMHPNATVFPDVTDKLPEYAAQEHELFVKGLVFDDNAGFEALLTSNRTFVNAELAGIYG